MRRLDVTDTQLKGLMSQNKGNGNKIKKKSFVMKFRLLQSKFINPFVLALEKQLENINKRLKTKGEKYKIIYNIKFSFHSFVSSVVKREASVICKIT